MTKYAFHSSLILVPSIHKSVTILSPLCATLTFSHWPLCTFKSVLAYCNDPAEGATSSRPENKKTLRRIIAAKLPKHLSKTGLSRHPSPRSIVPKKNKVVNCTNSSLGILTTWHFFWHCQSSTACEGKRRKRETRKEKWERTEISRERGRHSMFGSFDQPEKITAKTAISVVVRYILSRKPENGCD